MPTAAQEIAALKRAVKDIENRLEVLERERPKLEQRLEEGFAEQKAVMDVLLKQRSDDRIIADQRHENVVARMDTLQTRMDAQHAAVMAQFEKLLAKPSEN